MPDLNKTPNKGDGKGPVLGLNKKPLSQAEYDKYKAVDKKQTALLKTSNKKLVAKQKAVKAAVALAKKPVTKKPAAKKVK